MTLSSLDSAHTRGFRGNRTLPRMQSGCGCDEKGLVSANRLQPYHVPDPTPGLLQPTRQLVSGAATTPCFPSTRREQETGNGGGLQRATEPRAGERPRQSPGSNSPRPRQPEKGPSITKPGGSLRVTWPIPLGRFHRGLEAEESN